MHARPHGRRPALSLTIILTLALGIGANALVFSVVRGVLLKPLRFAEPHRLVALWETQPGHDTRGVAPANFLDWRSADGCEGWPRTTRSAGCCRASSRNGSRWRRFGGDPAVVGRTIRLDDEALVVAGIVATGRAFPENAVAWTQAPYDVPELGSGAPTDLRRMRDAWYFPAARETVRRVHPGAPVGAIQTLSAIAAGGIAAERSAARALGIFGALALVLAAVGLHGVMARLVADRTRELGVRMALGAAPSDVRRLVLARMVRIAAAGVALGAAGSFALSRHLGLWLHGASAADPLVFTAAAGLLGGAALAAGYLPARRAGAIDPILAIKAE